MPYGIAPPSRMSRALFGGLKPTLHYCGALGRRGRLELSMVSPELVSRFQGIAYGLWATGFYTETIQTVYAWMSRWVNESPAEGPCNNEIAYFCIVPNST